MQSSGQGKQAPDVAKRGRPREFDEDRVLSAALDVFLSKGYVGASLSELTGAMRINRPSLYHCFKSKEQLFKRAIELHARRHLDYLQTALEAPTVREAAKRLLCGALTNREVAGGVRGFLGMLSSMPAESEVSAVRRAVAMHQAVAISALIKRLSRARDEGELSADAHPAALAYFLEALVHGIAVQERNGAPLADLEELVDVALGAIDRSDSTDASASRLDASTDTPTERRAFAASL
jgi:AcrR family transcriptional regulator